MRFLPLFLDLSSQTIALIGNSQAAINKLRLLHSAGATVCWFPGDVELSAEFLSKSALPGRVEIDPGEPFHADFSRFTAVVIAYGDDRDEVMAQYVRSIGVLVNSVDRPDLSNFIFPAIVDRGDVVIAIGTNGASPVLARRLRERIEALLPTRIGDLAALILRHRDRFARSCHSSRSSRRFWERVIDGPIGAATLAGHCRDAERRLVSAINNANLSDEKSGVVFLVGAGPGAPDLLTLRALQVLQDADVVFYDEFVTQAILARSRRDAEHVFVGKHKDTTDVGQDEINRRLVQAANAGKVVVRLQGGDQFVLGFSGQELKHLREAEVPTFVIPGATASSCAPELGLPLTYRIGATD